jgi:hypothetical protein
MAARSAFSPTEGGVCPAWSSMSPSNLKSCFCCASASEYCCTVCYCYFNAERLFVQNIWYPGTGTCPILDTILTFHFAPRVPNIFIYRGAKGVVGTLNKYDDINSAFNTSSPLNSLEFLTVSRKTPCRILEFHCFRCSGR